MPSQSAPAFLTHVAHNVRSLRTAAGLSQKALAEASGVSLRMIGGIENGATSVSTSTLDRIGTVLGASLSDLVADPVAERSVQINRLGWQGKRGGRGVLLTSVAARREVETWEWILAPGERYEAGADPKGWHVQVIVVEGCLSLRLADGEHRLTAEAFVFDSAQAHAFANREETRLRFFRITSC